MGAPRLQQDLVQLHLLHRLGGSQLQGPRQQRLRGRPHRLHPLPRGLHRNLQIGPRTPVQCTDRYNLQTNVREDFTITEMAPTRAFSWLKEDVKLKRQLKDHINI